jgi:hypothetical protein
MNLDSAVDTAESRMKRDNSTTRRSLIVSEALTPRYDLDSNSLQLNGSSASTA